MNGAKKPALTGDALQWVTDYDAYTFTNDCSAYRSLVESYPIYAEAMGYASLHVDARTGKTTPDGASGIWETIDAAVGLGYVADIAVPSPGHPAGAGNSYTHYTRAQAIETYAAKIAHAFWIETTRPVPWRLADYDLERLQYILHTDHLFMGTSFAPSWDLSADPAATNLSTCDHSPKKAYDLAMAWIGTPTKRVHALGDLVLIGQRYLHGAGLGTCRTIDEYESSKTTNGCYPASTCMAALARSVNISPRAYTGKAISSLHASFTAHTTASGGHALIHGDDLYNSTSGAGTGPDKTTGASPGVRRMAPLSEWNMLVGDEEDEQTAYDNSIRLGALAFSSWPTPGMVDSFTYDGQSSSSLTGWPTLCGYALAHYRNPYLSNAEVDAVYSNFSRMSGTTGLPSKLDATNTGPLTSLTPASGPLVIDNAWVVANGNTYEGKDFTGSLTITATSQFFLKDCSIDGDGGVALTLGPGAYVWVYNCEITGGTIGVQGMPYHMIGCHIHSNTSNAVLVDETAIAGANDSAMFYNFIDAGASNTALHITTGSDRHIACFANTIVSTSAIPLILIDGAPTEQMEFAYNWIDGGNSCFLQNSTTSPDTVIRNNLFGKSATVQLHNRLGGAEPTWHENVYEIDGSEADIGDTAPFT